ncbi:phytoene desaturase family protein [Croceimicrobium sp.]|uniref:phytoene desaturase family protein n=1 Tax=Croceimicrobium sp. TaxID=2828340 RepID=UPI003BA92DC8
MGQTAIVVGAGFAGLSAASSLAQKGFQVKILEKNAQAGGRARAFKHKGFHFDMGPSWYWMPDVFEAYFQTFGKKVSDYYQLDRLDPSYRVYFGSNDFVDLPAGTEAVIQLFEKIEKGSGAKLKKFIQDSAYKYEVGINDLVYKPGRSLLEFADWRIARGLIQLDLLKSMRRYVQAHFKNPRLQQIMEFPILFLGATPQNTPALYSLMNYADIDGGTWFPRGGMYEIVKAMVAVAEEQGVEILCNQEVISAKFKGDQIIGLQTNQAYFEADVILNAADYHHFEQEILPKEFRQYSPKYWETRAMAPSSLLFYLAVDKKVPGLLHHTLFFDEDFDQHAREIYESPQWPSKPLFYVSATSKTDSAAAPEGQENLFLLMPLAPGLKDDAEQREKYYHLMMDRLEAHIGAEIRPHVHFKRSYAMQDFKNDYHAFKGNAYGLANTLSQTAILKPSLKSKKVANLYYAGQLTTPGPGVPPSLISGLVAAAEIEKDTLKNRRHESIV